MLLCERQATGETGTRTMKQWNRFQADHAAHHESARAPNALDRLVGALVSRWHEFWSQHGWSIATVVIFNLIPLLGVVFFRWSIKQVLLVYWLETALFVLAQPIRGLARRGWRTIGQQLAVTAHACVFTGAHAFFLLSMLYGIQWDEADQDGLSWSAPTRGAPGQWLDQALADIPLAAIVMVAIVSCVSLGSQLPGLRRARRADMAAGRNSGDIDTRSLYGPVVIMHVSVIFGGFVILSLNSPIGLLLLLITLKIGYDLFRTINGKPETDGAAGAATS